MNKNRSKEEIVADILSVVAEKPKKTHIMYKANLSYALLCKYLEMLVKSELVEYSESTRVYVLCHRGEDYLKTYNEYVNLKGLLESNALIVNKKGSILVKILNDKDGHV